MLSGDIYGTHCRTVALIENRKVCNKMYKEDDFLARHEEVNEDMLKQLLDGTNVSDEARNGCDMQQQKQCDQAPRRGACMNPRARTMLENERMSGCDSRKTWGLHGYPLASVFAPLQEWKNLYDNEIGLDKGTIFEELYLPFLGAETSPNGCGSCENGYRRKGMGGGCSNG